MYIEQILGNPLVIDRTLTQVGIRTVSRNIEPSVMRELVMQDVAKRGRVRAFVLVSIP